MNTQKYVISSIAAGAWMIIYGFVVWAIVLADYLAGIAPAGMMLPEADQNMVYILVGSFIQAFGLGLIYVRNHEGKGAMEGVRFGIYVAIFMLGIYTLMTGVSPYTERAAITYWMIDSIMYIGAGVVFALTYKK